jgi:hypothetical protein
MNNNELVLICKFMFFMSLLNYCCAGSDEQKFLEASMAYVSGNPILNDRDYDALKLRLKVCYLLIFFSFMKSRFCIFVV